MNRNSLGDLVGDTTHDLAAKSKDALQAAGDYIAPRARDLADYLAPRLHELADNLGDYLEPKAKDLGQRGAQFAANAAEAIGPKIDQLTAETRESLRPYVADTRAKVQPLVDAGRDRLNQDVLPLLSETYESVATSPTTQEAKKRLNAAAAALTGELILPEPKKRKAKWKTALQVVAAVGLVTAVVLAVKRFLAPEDAGWEAYSPSYDEAPAEEDPLLAEDDTLTQARRLAEEPAAEDAESDPFLVSPYGDGSYVGGEPPAEFVIKGNERSMKYHVEGTEGYERTIADVWFRSEEAAEAAGFTRAQR